MCFASELFPFLSKLTIHTYATWAYFPHYLVNENFTLKPKSCVVVG